MKPDTLFPASLLERCLVLPPPSFSDSNPIDTGTSLDQAIRSLIYDVRAGCVVMDDWYQRVVLRL